MREYELTTLYVDYSHLLQKDDVLADAIQMQYYRFLPYLRRALQNLVAEYEPEYLKINPTAAATDSVNLQSREFNIAFYHLPLVSAIRDLRTDKIGTLMSISGTVTSTSEVRPELLFGSFICEVCGGLVNEIEQQFKYTEVCSLSMAGSIPYDTDEAPHVHSPVSVQTRRATIAALGSSKSTHRNSRTGKKFASKRTRRRFQQVPCLAHLTSSFVPSLSNARKLEINASLRVHLLWSLTSANWG